MNLVLSFLTLGVNFFSPILKFILKFLKFLSVLKITHFAKGLKSTFSSKGKSQLLLVAHAL